MRSWARLNTDTKCGSCGLNVLRDTPIQIVTFRLITKYRGPCCAEEKPPADLPAAPIPKQSGDFSNMVKIGTLKPRTRGDLRKVVKEWKPYREPGMEG